MKESIVETQFGSVTAPGEGVMSDPLLRFFEYGHLPPHLAEISAQFKAVATWMRDNLPDNEERHVALRKLLEAKDCAVRAKLP